MLFSRPHPSTRGPYLDIHVPNVPNGDPYLLTLIIKQQFVISYHISAPTCTFSCVHPCFLFQSRISLRPNVTNLTALQHHWGHPPRPCKPTDLSHQLHSSSKFRFHIFSFCQFFTCFLTCKVSWLWVLICSFQSMTTTQRSNQTL